jgi:hypothetical protein
MARFISLGVQKVLAKYAAYSGSRQKYFILLVNVLTVSLGVGESDGAGFRMSPPGGTAHALSSMVKRITSKRMRALSYGYVSFINKIVSAADVDAQLFILTYYDCF